MNKKFYNHIRGRAHPTHELETKEEEWEQDYIEYLLDNR